MYHKRIKRGNLCGAVSTDLPLIFGKFFEKDIVAGVAGRILSTINTCRNADILPIYSRFNTQTNQNLNNIAQVIEALISIPC